MPVPPDDSTPNARNTDPSTSHAAAKVINLKDRTTVRELYLDFDPMPLADFQMEAQLGGTMNGKWRKRRSDLTNEGFLIAVGTVFNPNTGLSVTTWGVNRARHRPPPSPQLKLL